MGIRLSDSAYELLGVVNFSRPDPVRRIAPHLIVLDDGRGIDMGRIARITVNTPFSPPPSDIIYQDSLLPHNQRNYSELFSETRSKNNSARVSDPLLNVIQGVYLNDQVSVA